MKRTVLALALILALSVLLIAGMQTLEVAKANAIPIAPPSDVTPPTISINPLINNTVFAQNEISLTLNVSIPETEAIDKYGLYLSYIQLQRNWNDEVVNVYLKSGSGPGIADFSNNLTLTDIPEGSHNITFIINVHGGILWMPHFYYFNLTSYSPIYFSVDTTCPSVSISFIENRTYEKSDIPLNFTVNEQIAKVSYSLDGLNNVTVAGNTTLSGLSVGVHNVKVYAWDTAGNVGVSETVTFSIGEPFPVVPVATVAVASISVVVVALLLYFKKRKH